MNKGKQVFSANSVMLWFGRQWSSRRVKFAQQIRYLMSSFESNITATTHYQELNKAFPYLPSKEAVSLFLSLTEKHGLVPLPIRTQEAALY